MNQVEAGEKEKEKAEQDKAKLEADLHKVEAETGKVTQDQAEALKRSAPEDVAKASAPFDKRLFDLGLKEKRLRHLIVDATVKIETARNTLKEAEEDQKRRFAEYVRAEDEKFFSALAASLPQKAEEIVTKYCELCTLLGELRIDQVKHGPTEKFLFGLADVVGNGWRARGMRPLAGRGWVAPIEVISGLPSNAEGVPLGAGMIGSDDVARARRAIRIEKLRAEFLQKEV